MRLHTFIVIQGVESGIHHLSSHPLRRVRNDDKKKGRIARPFE
ncbi:MAG: hypothetical protein ABIY40_04660 [Rhodanobacteraceae bacterium]